LQNAKLSLSWHWQLAAAPWRLSADRNVGYPLTGSDSLIFAPLELTNYLLGDGLQIDGFAVDKPRMDVL